MRKPLFILSILVAVLLCSCSEKQDYRVSFYCYSPSAKAEVWHGNEYDSYDLSENEGTVYETFTIKEGQTLRVRVECLSGCIDPYGITMGANVWEGTQDDSPQILDVNKAHHATSAIDFAHTFIP